MTPAMAKLCGVSAVDKLQQVAGEIRGSAAALSGVHVRVKGPALALKAADATVLATLDGRPLVTTRRVGRGRAVATALISTPAALMRHLVVSLGGPLPIKPDPASARHVYVTALTDGKRTAIGVIKDAGTTPREVRIRLADIAPRTGRVATNVHQGTQQAIGETLTVRLPAKPNAWCFVLIQPASEAQKLARIGSAASTIAPSTASKIPGEKRTAK